MKKPLQTQGTNKFLEEHIETLQQRNEELLKKNEELMKLLQ